MTSFHVFPVVCRYHALASSAERWCGTLVIRVLACKAVLYLASTRPDAKRVQGFEIQALCVCGVGLKVFRVIMDPNRHDPYM